MTVLTVQHFYPCWKLAVKFDSCQKTCFSNVKKKRFRFRKRQNRIYQNTRDSCHVGSSNWDWGFGCEKKTLLFFWDLFLKIDSYHLSNSFLEKWLYWGQYLLGCQSEKKLLWNLYLTFFSQLSLSNSCFWQFSQVLTGKQQNKNEIGYTVWQVTTRKWH